MQQIICPDCGGDGKETCNNPDHGFINMNSFNDIGRIGCPCCGHDPDYKIKHWKDGKWLQQNCETCNGSGNIDQNQFDNFCDATGYNEEPDYLK